jgi:hypothetical protein
VIGPLGGGCSDGSIEHALAHARALRGVTLHEMTELMAEGRGELGFVLENRQQAARHEHIPWTACALAKG